MFPIHVNKINISPNPQILDIYTDIIILTDEEWKHKKDIENSKRISEDKKTSLLNRLKEKKKEINQTRKVKEKIKHSQNNIER